MEDMMPCSSSPDGRLVNVLTGADELSAPLTNVHDDLNVIGPVARQAIDLVDDHVINVALLEPFQHGLQGRSVGRLGRLAPVNVLLDYLGVQLLSFALTGFTLAGDGEPPRRCSPCRLAASWTPAGK
jgi:hypothetical protein